MTWLPEEFPEARILCVNYDSCIRRSAEHGRLDLHNAAEMLMVNLKLARVCQHPIILIGHSYGGLVIKQLCLQALMRETLKKEEEGDVGFLNCIKGVFFYGTPHHGSSFFSNVTDLKDASPLLDFVHSVMIVHEASARYGEFTMEQEDHFSLCQPKSKVSNTYSRLTEFIQCIGEDIYGFKGMRSFHELKKVPKMAMVLRSHLFKTVRNYLVVAPLVGLHGMGGVGKTTLAKLLVKDLCAEFDYTCFIPVSNLKGDYEEITRR
ncbi:hypothetical protein AXG93_369s1340 [Marchantia polymorpha subsp. ruderalis]|uniref:NB-ARC domain-containing protein n=1 Tax=Marchantia polymorpha subsp. ruderalis TaxID=1480154 RepID=A0A176VSQ0_MARPO|nr:hypothetical protein AXG93_369s1340 [Marchantia polymorpha subsp. ruderalis]